MSNIVWKHNQLAEDLADIKGTNFLDIPLGSVWLEKPQRADVLEVKPSYTRFCISIYEIKISRADFLSDIRSEKWRGYLEHCHRFYFAVPSGLVDKKEIPEEAGLIVRGDTGWKTIKAPLPRFNKIPETTMMSMIFAKQRLNHSKQKRESIRKELQYSVNNRQLYKKLGNRIKNALIHEDEYKSLTNDYKWKIEQIENAIKEGLGKEMHWPISHLNDLVRQIKIKAEQT